MPKINLPVEADLVLQETCPTCNAQPGKHCIDKDWTSSQRLSKLTEDGAIHAERYAAYIIKTYKKTTQVISEDDNQVYQLLGKFNSKIHEIATIQMSLSVATTQLATEYQRLILELNKLHLVKKIIDPLTNTVNEPSLATRQDGV